MKDQQFKLAVAEDFQDICKEEDFAYGLLLVKRNDDDTITIDYSGEHLGLGDFLKMVEVLKHSLC